MDLGIDDHEMEGKGNPINPIIQAISGSLLSLSVNVIFEFEEAITNIFGYTKVLQSTIFNPIHCFLNIIFLKNPNRSNGLWPNVLIRGY